jgi:hypothetical protein
MSEHGKSQEDPIFLDLSTIERLFGNRGTFENINSFRPEIPNFGLWHVAIGPNLAKG